MLQFLNHLAADPIQWQGRSRPAKPRLSGLGCVAAGVAAIFMVFHVDLVPNVTTMMTASISQAGGRVEWSESLALIFDQFHGITEGPRWKGGDDEGGGVRSHLDDLAKGGTSAGVKGKEDECCDGLGKDKGLDSLFKFVFSNDIELNEKQHKNIITLSEYEHNLHAINLAKRTTIDNAFAVGQAHYETLDPADVTTNKVCGTTCLAVFSLVWALVLILFTPGKSGNSRKELKMKRLTARTASFHPKIWFRNPSNIICILYLLTVSLAARANSPKTGDIASIYDSSQAKNDDGLGNLHSKDTKPFGLKDKLASLDVLSRASLRGGGEGNNGIDNFGTTISKVKSYVATYLSSIKVIQTHFHNDNNEEATKALSEIEASMNSEDMSDFDSPFVRTSSGAVSPLDDVTDAQLADFITDTQTLPGAFDQLVEHTQDFANLLNSIDEGMFDFEPVTAENTKHNRYSQMKPSGPNRRPSDKVNVISGFSKFGSFLQNDAAVTEKHRIRQEALGVCDPKCEPADAACHCKKLFECVSHLNEYDLAVLIAGGYIETDPASDHFGNFTINAESLNLFEVDVGVRQKLARIKDKAAAGPTNINACNQVLEELFTACPSGDPCNANSNTETHQLSVQKICDSVKTPTKLLFEVVGDEFDGFVGDSSSDATCEPLSFDLCRDFAVQFDRLYEGRGGDSNYANPMRKNPDVGHHSTGYTVPARKIRIQLQGKKHLNLAEVEVYDAENNNIALGKPATQSSDWDVYGEVRIASNAVDGDHETWSGTDHDEGAWLEIDLESTVQVKRIVIYNRFSHSDFWLHWDRLSNSDVTLRNEEDAVVWKYGVGDASELRAISLDVFGNLQLPTSYIYPQDEVTGIVNRDTFGDSQGVKGHFALINPATGKALGLAVNDECTDGALVEAQKYNRRDPDPRQLFQITLDGELESVFCPRLSINAQSVSDTKDCVGGSALGLGTKNHHWRIGPKGRIDFNVDCSVKHVPNLAITAVEDNDIKTMKGRNIYVSITNPTTGKAMSTTSNSTVHLDNYDSGDEHQLFRLLPFDDHVLIQSRVFPDKVLSTSDCGSSESGAQIMLVERQYCIRANTKDCDTCGGYVDVFVDSGDGYVMITTVNELHQRGEPVFDQCFDRIVGIQVTANGRDNDIWAGTFQIRNQTGTSPTDDQWTDLLCKDCTGSTNTMPMAVVSVDRTLNGYATTHCERGDICELVPGDEKLFKRGVWKLKKGTMELHGCGKVASISASQTPVVQEDEEAWNQKWTVAAYGSLLLPAENGEENQEWEAHYMDAPYNYALLPMFPGVGLPCLARVTDSAVFKAIIHQFDMSMSLLVGSQTSLGTLRKIVDEVDEFGPSRMPGSCCFDSPTTNDRYFGIDYDPNIMLCQNKGPFHLGISEEACHNAGGRWFRNPCLTLKECIDKRPSKFDLKNPIEKDCQDAFGQPNIAYVSTSASDIAADHAEASCVEMGGILSSYDKMKADDGSTIRYCCPEGCRECGGSGCHEFSLGAENCCIGLIEDKCETEWTAGFAVPARKIRIQLQGQENLNLDEVEVYDAEDKNVALGKPATQSSVSRLGNDNIDKVAGFAVDGNRNTFSATQNDEGAWLEVDLELTVQVKRIVIYNRGSHLDFWGHWDRLSNSDVTLRNEEDDVVWQYSIGNATLLSMLSVPTSLGETGSTPCRFYIEPFEQSCLEFCQSLPGYGYGGNQIAMMTDQSSSISSDPQCICMYQEGTLPEEEELPEHATRSLPAFHLTNSGSVLGLGTNDCSATEIGVELQRRVDGKSQQFHLSYDNQIVSAACPNLVLTADCSSGKISFQSYRDTTWNRQKWSFADDNTIFNSECQTMKISAIKDDIESLALESFYFSLINPSTSLAMGFDGTDCEEGTSIVLQKAIRGSPGQQFYMEEGSNVLRSLMCPGMVIGKNSTPSLNCNSTTILLTRLSDESEWTFNDDASVESKVSCAGKVIDIDTNGKLSAVTGAPLILSNHSEDTFSMYQRWERSHQKLAVLSGPYAFVQPSSGLAIGIEASDDSCAILETALVSQQDSYSANFHLGNSGEIHFSKCPGLLLAIDSAAACDGSRLRLQTATRDDSAKWKINGDGTISSIKCPNHFIKIDGGSNAEVGAVILLRSNESSERQPWVKVNTRLLEDVDTAILGNWNTEWSIDFGHVGLPLARDGNLYDAVCGSSESTSERSCAGQIIENAHQSEEYAVRCCADNGYELLDSSSDRCPGDLLIRSEDECREAGLLVGGRLRFGQVVAESWNHVPCGCSLQGRKGDIHFDANLDACEEGTGYTPVCKKLGWEKYPGCDVWGESELNGECHGNSTHEDARALCDSVGARLCTREELLEDCTRHSGCGYDWELVWSSTNGKQCYTTNSAFSQSFEDFAGEIVIHDASDEEQCRHARAELGFGEDHPYDTEVCRVFEENMCDGHFTEVDHMTEGFGPPVFTEVNFEAPKYPEDPELNFNALPEHTPFQDHTPNPYNKKKVLDLQKSHLNLEQLLWAYKEWQAFTLDVFDFSCNIHLKKICIPVMAGNGGFCSPNPAYLACMVAAKTFRVWACAHEKALEVTYRAVKFAHAYTVIQPDVEISTAAYTTATFNGLKEFDKWNQKSLNTINNNIFRQHSEMREHLQDRHQAMTNDIVEFIEEATNILGNEFNKQNQWLDTILCKIYELHGAEKCYGTGKSVLDMVVEWPENATTLWGKMHRIEEATQGNQDVVASRVSGPSQRLVWEETELGDDKAATEGKIDKLEVSMKKSEDKMDAIESSIEKIEDKMNELKRSMDKIEVKMEDKMNVLESSMDKIEVKMEDKMNVLERSMDKIEVKMEDKMNVLESSMDKMEVKMEDKMNVLESSMDKMEVKMEDMKGAMDDMKGMMSQLIQAMTTATTDVGE